MALIPALSHILALATFQALPIKSGSPADEAV